jgi:hypothetical protein
LQIVWRVVVPMATFNGGRFIAGQLASLADQSLAGLA